MNKSLIFFIIIICFVLKYFYSNKTIKQNKMNIIVLNNFLSSEHCEALINLGKDRFKPSTIYGLDSSVIDLGARTSSNAFFKRSETPFIKIIEDYVANICNVDVNQLEPIQLGKYTKGQEYKYHYDYFDENSDQNKNQRIKTFLLYLNTIEEKYGGATDFKLVNKSFNPVQGKVIIWNNKNGNKLNKMSLHCGKPIIGNVTKYIMTIWIREFPYD